MLTVWLHTPGVIHALVGLDLPDYLKPTVDWPFNTEWYTSVGATLQFTVLSNFLIPIATKLALFLGRRLKLRCKRCCRGPTLGAATQNELTSALGHGEWNLASSYGELSHGR